MSEHNIQVDKEHYHTDAYNHKARWNSFFYQLEALRKVGAKNILEIGPGRGLVATLARQAGVKVTTVDIDPELKPDYVASVGKLPFNDGQFDAVCAFEVLEHIPFGEFKANLKEIYRVSSRYVIISLPDKRRILLNVMVKIPFLKYKEIFIRIPYFRRHKFDGQHYWEIGKTGYPVGRIKKAILDSGFRIRDDFACSDAPSNHFFILEK